MNSVLFFHPSLSSGVLPWRWLQWCCSWVKLLLNSVIWLVNFRSELVNTSLELLELSPPVEDGALSSVELGISSSIPGETPLFVIPPRFVVVLSLPLKARRISSADLSKINNVFENGSYRNGNITPLLNHTFMIRSRQLDVLPNFLPKMMKCSLGKIIISH